MRILSLDGGGVRGVFSAALLAELEENLPSSIGAYFDLIAGTSTGGIMALGLSAGKSAREMRNLYQDNASSIFVDRSQPGIAVRALLRLIGGFSDKIEALSQRVGISESKYTSAPLREVLEEEFGGLTLNDLETARTVIPAIDLTRAATVVFKTPHLPNLTRDRRFSVVDVAMATSAAPTFFPHSTIEEGSAYSDGGLWANNPAMVALAEAEQIIQRCTREQDPTFDREDINILSIGTGKPQHYGRPSDDQTGLVWWAPRIIDVVGLSQSQGVDNLVNYILNDNHYRINFQIPDNTWRLDNTEHLDQLVHFGREKATQEHARLRDVFFGREAEPFHPFPVN